MLRAPAKTRHFADSTGVVIVNERFAARHFPGENAVGRVVTTRHSATLVAIGLIAGVVIVQLARGALSRVLYEVSPSDATSTVAAGGLLLVAALVACIPPALRAMRVDPVEGLRAE